MIFASLYILFFLKDGSLFLPNNLRLYLFFSNIRDFVRERFCSGTRKEGGTVFYLSLCSHTLLNGCTPRNMSFISLPSHADIFTARIPERTSDITFTRLSVNSAALLLNFPMYRDSLSEQSGTALHNSIPTAFIVLFRVKMKRPFRGNVPSLDGNEEDKSR